MLLFRGPMNDQNRNMRRQEKPDFQKIWLNIMNDTEDLVCYDEARNPINSTGHAGYPNHIPNMTFGQIAFMSEPSLIIQVAASLINESITL